MTATQSPPTAPAPERRSGELTLRELLRWAWRQLTSMRIALILLLLLALAAVPGSVIPQERRRLAQGLAVEGRSTRRSPRSTRSSGSSTSTARRGSPRSTCCSSSRWSAASCRAPSSTPAALRAQPPAAPRNLTRLPEPRVVRHDASRRTRCSSGRAQLLKRSALPAAPPTEGQVDGATVSAERGYLREVGNLVFHLAVLVVLVGFALGSLFGYKGGVILVHGHAVRQQPRRSTTTSCPAACSTPTAWTRSPSPSTTSTSSG